jgi:nucleobase:cation symporter-1, NCS1 family
MTGIGIYLTGIVVQIPFLDTAFYSGPLVGPLGGVDVSWIVGLLVPGLLYYLLGQASRQRAPPQPILPA